MADAFSVIPANVLHNLSDKFYEKRKNAALEVEVIVKSLTTAGDHEKISSVIQLLTQDFTYSLQANHRKVENRSSEFHPEVRRVRREGSYIYEEFMPTGGTDVKVVYFGIFYERIEDPDPMRSAEIKRMINAL